MNLYQTAAPGCLLPRQSIDYAGAGLQWSVGFNCYVRQMGRGGDYWLLAYPSPKHGIQSELFLICDEDVLMSANLKDNAGLTRAIARAQRVINHRYELAECEDLDDLTERLGMGRMFGTVAIA
jgi:hypothetical protein